DSEGWQIDSRVQQAMGDVLVIDKPTFGSCLLADHVAELAEQEELEITLCGLCTDICVVSNALLLKAHLPETKIRVAANCCAGVTPESHAAALKTMQMCQIEMVYTVQNAFGRKE
ncbi:MAG: isochorismatase family protein, partial [Oscillospiraceae bacterium]|nr:isochorismatase family protein [Oscillospiraceae bacterium]